MARMENIFRFPSVKSVLSVVRILSFAFMPVCSCDCAAVGFMVCFLSWFIFISIHFLLLNFLAGGQSSARVGAHGVTRPPFLRHHDLHRGAGQAFVAAFTAVTRTFAVLRWQAGERGVAVRHRRGGAVVGVHREHLHHTR